MPLEPQEFYNGLTCLIFISISIIVGIKLALKYFENKNRVFLLVGLTWIILVAPWWPPTVSFLIILIFNVGIPNQIYFLIGVPFIPIGLLLWLTAFTDLVYKDKQKIILIIFAIVGVIFEIFFLYFLFTNPSVIVVRFGTVEGEYLSFVIIYMLSVLGIFLVTGIIFVLQTLKVDDPKVKLKAKFLFAAIISFTIGSAIDGLTAFNIIAMTIYRAILISSAIEFYFGFFLPQWIEKLFIKQK